MPTESVVPAEQAPEGKAAANSYGDILRSSALIGGSQVLSIAVSIVRTKAMALLLGPAGVGLFGLYGSILDLAQAVAGMGVNNSGVRQIAEAAGTGDARRVARTVAVLRRTSIILGLLAFSLMIVLARPISWFTFDSAAYTSGISLLSLAALFRLVSAGQGALLQGMRRIGDLARMNFLGALSGTVISIPLVYFLREDGVVPSLIAIAGMTILTSWWYSRKVDLPPVKVSLDDVYMESQALLKLGAAFMASGLMLMGSSYAVRAMVAKELGLVSAGLYQSAWAIGGLYVGIILQAMGSDFYPRLTAAAGSDDDMNRLVNEQTRVGLLLGTPGILATLIFTPLVLSVFYSSRFGPAVDVLRWICLGLTLRVLNWPMGYIILARARQNLFFWSELFWTGVYLALAKTCIGAFGLSGAGMAFAGAYCLHGILVYALVRKETGYSWSPANRRSAPLLLASILGVFLGFQILPFAASVAVGAIVLIAVSVYSLRQLLALFPEDASGDGADGQQPLRKLLKRARGLMRNPTPGPR